MLIITFDLKPSLCPALFKIKGVAGNQTMLITAIFITCIHGICNAKRTVASKQAVSLATCVRNMLQLCEKEDKWLSRAVISLINETKFIKIGDQINL